jgi:hypothetical protein
MNAIKSKLSKWQIHNIGGNYVQTQTIKLPDGKEREIMIFAGDKALYLGQCTIFQTILIHESTLSNKPLFDYILLHELIHTKQWWSVFIVPLIILIPVSLLLLIFSLVNLLLGVMELNLYGLLSSLVGILISAFLFSIPCSFSWIMELNADFKAIKEIGFESFIEIKNAPKILKRNFYSSIIIMMTHPPTMVTVKLWHWLHKAQG